MKNKIYIFLIAFVILFLPYNLHASEKSQENIIDNNIKIQNVQKRNSINSKDNSASSKKIIAKSGNDILFVNTDNRSSNGELAISGDKLSYNNGRIIKVDNGILSTIGGSDRKIFMYDTISDVINKENGISLNGGSYEGQYIETVKKEDKYYFKGVFSGREGFISAEDAQIIPKSLIKAQSYYKVNNGVWTYFQAVSNVYDKGYTQFPLGDAPEWAKSDVKYYTNDYSTFYEDNIIKRNSISKASEDYFMNLPFRSSSEYTAADYKKFLKDNKKTNAKYYNDTKGFIEAQEKEFVNSMFIFALANHEGGFGTSFYSNKCNNFFGRGAFDSDPDNACKSFGFPTPRDGILAQSIFMNINYADVDWWGSTGLESGNKNHGMNVYYASAQDWGVAMSSHMHQIDRELGGKEINKYRIYEVKTSSVFKSDSALKSSLKKKPQGKTEVDYKLPMNVIQDKKTKAKPRLISVEEKSGAVKVQLPMGKNLGASSYVKFTSAEKGSYPNYNGLVGGKGNQDNYVNKGTANFANKYGSWKDQEAWYPSSSLKFVVGNKKPTSPELNTVKKENIKMCTNGVVQKEKTTTKLASNGKIIDTISIERDCKSKNQIDYVHEMFDKNGKKTYYRKLSHFTNKKVKVDRMITYYGNSGIVKQDLTSKYNGKGSRVDYMNKMNNNKNKRTYYRHITKYENDKNKYDRNVTYQTEKGIVKQDLTSYYNSKGVITDYTNEMKNTSNKRTYYRHIMRFDNNKTSYDRNITYHSGNGVAYQDFRHTYNNKGIKTDYMNEMYDKKTKKRTYYRHIMLNKSGKKTYDRMITYYGSTGVINKDIIYKK